MSGPSFIITGPTGGAPNRLEINDFVKDVKFFSLYIQALDAMYKLDQPQLQSFFQLGAIHGLPYTPWNNVPGNPPYDWGGYCTHGSVLFPTWHRPYVMVYEQILQARALEIAERYTVDKEGWKKAAELLRQPYWDWAEKSVPPDEVVLLKQVSIVKPETNGEAVLVDNPLLYYGFHPIDSSFGSPYSGWPATLRHPTSRQPDAMSDIQGLIADLGARQTEITTKIYHTLTQIRTWPAFSNHTSSTGGGSNSLESVHDSIHVYVGRGIVPGTAGGHMADPAYAGFDPIFFMHHCNVDRMLSLWSALNPGVWVTPGTSLDGTFTIRPDVQVDENTALTPFWNSQTSFWPSATVEATSKLGYTYPEFNGLDMGNPEAVRIAIAIIVNRLYGGIALSSLKRLAVNAAREEGAKKEQVSSLSGIPAGSNPIPTAQVAGGSLPAKEHGGEYPIPHQQPSEIPYIGVWDWTARVEVKHNELRQSFSVLIFLGRVPDDPADWIISSNYIGGHHAFVNSRTERCSRCSEHEDELEEGFVHLNHGIAEHSRLSSLDPNVVEPYLARNLQWRVQKMDGTEAELESLEVTVIATPMTYPPGTMFPVPGEIRHFNGITHGKRGGSRRA